MAQPTTFITLGTAGGPVPKTNRAQPAHAIVHGGRPILVDCGEGAMDQLMRAGIDFREVEEIFISHHHIDHIGSLFACFGKNMMTMRQGPLTIYGPPGTRRIVDALVSACDVSWEIGLGFPGRTMPHPRDFVEVREVLPGDAMEIDGLRISCCENTHYRSEDSFGQEGPVSLAFRFDAPDRSIVFTGDTGPCRTLEAFAQGAQLLVGEMIDVDGVLQRIRKKNPNMPADRMDMMARHLAEHHLIPEQLGALAQRAGVAHVVAVHIPLETITAETAPGYIERIASAFSGEITIAEDLDRF